MDEASQRTLIKTKARRVIEAAQSRPAGRANTLIVQRISIQEWRIADRTEIIRLQRGRGLQAVRANRNPRPFHKWLLANPAIGRE
jgi:hypothetical protein